MTTFTVPTPDEPAPTNDLRLLRVRAPDLSKPEELEEGRITLILSRPLTWFENAAAVAHDTLAEEERDFDSDDFPNRETRTNPGFPELSLVFDLTASDAASTLILLVRHIEKGGHSIREGYKARESDLRDAADRVNDYLNR